MWDRWGGGGTSGEGEAQEQNTGITGEPEVEVDNMTQDSGNWGRW